MNETLRVFCAIELPADVRSRLADRISQLRTASPEAKASWARDEALHVTLKFIGDIESHRLPALTRAAKITSQGVQSFSLVLENTGTFPAHGTPRVLWIGAADSSGNMDKLHLALDEECAREGFAPDERDFHPHLTIARQRAPKGAQTPAVLDRNSQFTREELPVTEFVVMRSELGPGGSRYTVLSRHALNGA